MLLFSFAVVYCMFRFDGPSSGGINLNLYVVRGVGGGGFFRWDRGNFCIVIMLDIY